MTHLRSLFAGSDTLSAAERAAMASLRRGGISSVIWVVTERCNLKCIHCYEGGRVTPELSTEEVLKIADKLEEAGRPLTFVSGGEPLLRDDIMMLLGRLKDLGIRVILSTNGTLVDEEVASQLADLGVDNVAIPLYGPQEVHDAFTRIPGSHERVIEALRLLRDHGLNLTIKTVVARRVLPYIRYLFDVAEEFGARAVYLCDFIPVGRGASLRGEVPSKDEWRSLLDWFIEEMILGNAYEGVEIDIGLHPSTAIYVMKRLREMGHDVSEAEERMRARRLSVEGRGFISISPTGDVYLSNYLTDLRLGNALHDDLRELLNHPLYRAAGDSSQLKGRCGACPYRDMCGGSRVKAHIYTGDLLGEDPTCVIQD